MKSKWTQGKDALGQPGVKDDPPEAKEGGRVKEDPPEVKVG